MKYTKELQRLITKALKEIEELLLKSKTKSKFSNENCLRITNNRFKFNLLPNRYLSEIVQDNLVDNEGYRYFFTVLNITDLFLLVDYLKNKNKNENNLS
jgi:hypothetical protein